MKILVNGTEKELEAIGVNGIEWTNDLLGNYDALHYNNDLEEYIMTEEEFAWWEPVVETLNKINALETALDEEAREEYEAECWPSDLDDEVNAKLEWLENHEA
ncbi:hypothetical protein [Faecalimonas umbilicata]|uniref:hypothetical protein n=1 Tax=Faecalimonas umbilicata TaxID=1912855 RepID=UPI0022DF5A1C|nr:hypothetical protein [Faecalimonas umbilicata]